MSIQSVFIAHSWSDVGVNIQTKAVAKKLSESIKVIYLSQSRIDKSQVNPSDNLKVIQWPNKRPNSLKDFWFLCKQIRLYKPDTLIVHFGATNICMLAAWLFSIRHRICWMHTPWQVYRYEIKNFIEFNRAVWMRRLSYMFSTNVVVLSEFGKQDALNHFKIPEKKITKIPNGILPVIGHRSKLNYNFISICFVGRLEKLKGVDMLLSAFAEISKYFKNVFLDIIGSGGEEQSLKQFVEEQALKGKVRFHGYFSDYGKVRKFISEAYCLVLPTRLDNFPTVILEALSCGVPVVASRVGGIPDIIIDKENGLLFEPNNEKELIYMLKQIMDIDFRNLLSANAQKSFEEKFTMQKHVENVMEFLNNLSPDKK